MTETVSKNNGLGNRFDIPFTDEEREERRKFYAKDGIEVFPHKR